MSELSSEQQPDRARSPWSRPGVLLSGAFVLALVLLGAVVAATGGANPSGARATVPPAGQVDRPPAPSAAPGANGSTAGGCSLPTGQQTIPRNGPPQASWGTVGSMQVPQNPTVYGPQRDRDGYASCFAHNPSGALLAALNFYAESTAGIPESEVMARYAAGAPHSLGNNSGLDNSGPVQFAGYRYLSYTPTEAQIAIVFRGARLLAVVTQMVWHGGDWKYLFPAGGVPAMQALTDLTGYVPWTGF